MHRIFKAYLSILNSLEAVHDAARRDIGEKLRAHHQKMKTKYDTMLSKVQFFLDRTRADRDRVKEAKKGVEGVLSEVRDMHTKLSKKNVQNERRLRENYEEIEMLKV